MARLQKGFDCQISITDGTLWADFCRQWTTCKRLTYLDWLPTYNQSIEPSSDGRCCHICRLQSLISLQFSSSLLPFSVLMLPQLRPASPHLPHSVLRRFRLVGASPALSLQYFWQRAPADRLISICPTMPSSCPWHYVRLQHVLPSWLTGLTQLDFHVPA